MQQPVLVNLACVPTLNVTHTINNILSVRPNDVGDAGITIRVESWPFMAPSNTVTLHVCGQRDDGNPFMLRVAFAEPVAVTEVSEGWQRSIPWAGLENLLHGSSLVFLLQVAFDDCCGCCPLLFPPLSLRVNVPWQDLTTFTDGDYNDWEAGSAAADPRDLSIIRDGDNFLLANRTYTDASDGIVLVKTFTELRVGEVYEFRVMVRRSNTRGTVPILALHAEDMVVAGPQEFPGLTWEPLQGAFIARSSTVTLNIVSENSSGQGNDYETDCILVRTI